MPSQSHLPAPWMVNWILRVVCSALSSLREIGSGDDEGRRVLLAELHRGAGLPQRGRRTAHARGPVLGSWLGEDTELPGTRDQMGIVLRLPLLPEGFDANLDAVL